MESIASTVKTWCLPQGSKADFWVGMVVASLLINLLGLAAPIALLQIYHYVIPNHDLTMLLVLLSILFFSLVLQNIVYFARDTIANWIDARLSMQQNNAAFAQLHQQRSQPIAQQGNTIILPNVSQTNTTAQQRLVWINFPFVLMSISLLAYLNYWLLLVPIVIIAIFLPLLRLFKSRAAEPQALQDFIYQSLSKKIPGQSSDILLRQYERLEKQDILSSYKAQMDHQSLHTLFGGAILLGLLGTTTQGALLVLSNSLSLGAFAASLLLVLQILYLCLQSYPQLSNKKSTPKMPTNIASAQQQQIATTNISLAHSLQPLLIALRDPQTIPAHFIAEHAAFDTYDLKKMLQHLNYHVDSFAIQLENIDHRLLPGVFVTTQGSSYVLLEKTATGFTAYDTAAQQNTALSNLEQAGYFYVARKKSTTEKPKASSHWVSTLLRPSKKLLWFTIVTNIFSSLLLLSLPLFMMFLFDDIIQTQAVTTLFDFSLGVLIAIVGIFGLQWFGAHFNSLSNIKMVNLVNYYLYRRLIQQQQPTTAVQDLSVELQDFLNLRRFFSGAPFTILLTLPCVIAAFVMLGYLESHLFYIIFAATIIIMLVILFNSNSIRRLMDVASQAEITQQKFALLHSIDPEKTAGQQQQKFELLTAQKVMANYRLNFMVQRLNVIINILGYSALIILLGNGAIAAQRGSLTLGELFASLVLGLMVIVPLKQLCFNLINILRLKATWQRINKLIILEQSQ